MKRILLTLLAGILLPCTAGAVVFSVPAKIKTLPPMMGDGLHSPVSVDPSSVTLLGNNVNQPGGPLQLTSSGTIPGDIITPSIIAVSTAIITPVETTASNGTLGVGTPFFAFTPGYDIEILKLTVTLSEPGEAGSTTWTCSDGFTPISLTTLSSYAVGSRTTVTASALVAKDTEVVCWLASSTQDVTPTAVISMQYIRR